MQWAMNYIVYDVRREGEAGGSPASGFGCGNFQSWRELIQKFRLARIKRVAEPSVDLKKARIFSLLNIYINYDINTSFRYWLK